MNRSPFPLCALLGALTLADSHAATIVGGNVTDTLGPSFFFDSAATGGGDFTVNQPNSGAFVRSFGTLNVGAGGSTITIAGIGWASLNSATANDATSATVAISYLGADGVLGGGDDVLIGTATDAYTFAGAAGEYVWAFDTAMSATIDGLNNLFRILITPTNGTSNGSLSFKSTLSNPNATAATVKLSVAGTSVAVVPEPSAALLGGLGVLLLARRRR
jgi:hypothetical protein